MIFGGKNYIGLDIGNTSVKVAQLKKTKKGVLFEKLALEPLFPNGKPDDVSEINASVKVSAIKRCLDKANITAKNAISAVSGESIIVRYIPLPEMSETELKNALRWEAEEYIPFRMDEVNIDSMILGKNLIEEGKIDVLLVSATKELINGHINILKDAGLYPVIVDIASFALLNCYEYNYKPSSDEASALISIGSDVTSITVFNNGVSRFTRDIEATSAGDSITKSLQMKLGLSFNEADKLKIETGAPLKTTDQTTQVSSDILDTIKSTVEKITGEDLGDDSIETKAAKMIQGSLDNLLGEIKRSIQFFENQPNSFPIKKIILSGGTAQMKNIVKYFTEELRLPIEIINPVKNIELSTKLDRSYIDSIAPQLSVCIGLAIRKVVD